MKIDVIDSDNRDGMVAYDMFRVYDFSDKIFRVKGQMCNVVQDLVDQIVNFVSESGRINVLRFWSHGSPTNQRLVTDPNIPDHPYDNNGFFLTTIEDNAYYLQKLTPLFAPDGIIELHGCSVGSGKFGEDFLSKFAASVNVPVVGQDQVQGGSGSALIVGSNAAWEAGFTTMAWPDGSITYGPGSTL